MRIRRVAKWAGTAICALILAVGVASMSWTIDVMNLVAVRAGVSILFHDAKLDATIDVTPIEDQSEGPVSVAERLTLAFSAPNVIDFQGRWDIVWLPLWLPLLIVAIPTALLWRSDRRRHPPNHCQACGYNLTGNLSGVCPECGGAIAEDGA